MSRRHRAERREAQPDPKFGNVKISRFMSSVMRQGKKSVAETIVYGALDQIEAKSETGARYRFSNKRSTMFRLRSKSVRAASAVRPIRFRSKSGRSVARRLRSAGSLLPRASATKKR